MNNSDVIERYETLQVAMQDASCAYPLAVPDSRLLAVVKRQPNVKIESLLEAGHRHFAENMVQEAKRRWPDWRARYHDIELHHIGALQTNKVREAVALYDVIQTLDRPKLAAVIHKEAGTLGKTQRCFVQVNIGEEPQKSGIVPAELAQFLKECSDYPHIIIEGLMCIPPATAMPAPYFALMRKLTEEHDIAHLSMGMSGDYEMALRFGATHIRIGTSLMGARDK